MRTGNHAEKIAWKGAAMVASAYHSTEPSIFLSSPAKDQRKISSIRLGGIAVGELSQQVRKRLQMQSNIWLILPLQNYSHFTISISVSAFVSPTRLPKFIPTDSGGGYERHDSHNSRIDSISHGIPRALHCFQSSEPARESDRWRRGVLVSVRFVAVEGFDAIREKHRLASA